MARASLRLLMGLAAILSLGVMAAPQLWSAAAQTRSRDQAATSTTFTLPPTITLPTTPQPTVTTAPIITTPPVTNPQVTRPRTTVTRPGIPGATTVATTAPSTTTTSTTIVPIPAGAPPPVTLPLASEPQSATISPVFSWLSGIGFVTLIGLLLAQWYLTGPNRRGPTL